MEVLLSTKPTSTTNFETVDRASTFLIP